MSPLIVPFPVLQRVCAPEGPPPRLSTVRRWAEREGIRYKYDGRGGIWTTVDALNAALGITQLPTEISSPEELI
ncbi:hypothetical protein [Vulcaniibacterium tengchongense]|uniref:Uncharacterized protein n=1 Tax=Vulcaniibacterium tengchongense TaxID=1273429 RepID=A0A3N4V4J9_9GAMM|nr:hypothetical protein [Vulcaniibacterium tengchongense]RPE74661.1 hypothetical protein EDC50_3190 [Vulcaniibacterium tengchongense]